MQNLNQIEGIKRVVILGHSGFIGKNIVDYLKKNFPDIEIVGKSFPEFDLTRKEDSDTLREFFNIETAVIMLSGIKPNIGNDTESFEKNVQMALNVCKALKQNPVRKFIFFSSAAVYGEDVHNTSINEKSLIDTQSYYGMAKYVSERLLWKTFSEIEGSTFVVFRPPVIYGPGEMAATYTPSGFLKTLTDNKEITLWGDGDELREFIYIDDLVKLVQVFTFNDYEGVLNISSGKSFTFKEVLDIISEFVDFDFKIKTRERSKDKVDNAFDNSLLKSLCPDFKFTSLKDGLKTTYESDYK
ncbi:NAD(P)-dependent oxidoreductase [Candidatus Woesearchaeota archaeon]|nr:NAD(P)-dependent oxidoreductase [Candidatus Woesearchaeota archaeon]